MKDWQRIIARVHTGVRAPRLQASYPNQDFVLFVDKNGAVGFAVVAQELDPPAVGFACGAVGPSSFP